MYRNVLNWYWKRFDNRSKRSRLGLLSSVAVFTLLGIFTFINVNPIFASADGTSAIGDLVWLDENANGTQDAGEDGIANVVVSLYNASNTLVATTTTNFEGGYLFTGVATGAYTVSVSAPAGLNATYDADGGTDNSVAMSVTGGVTSNATDFGLNWATSSDTNSPSAASTGAIGDQVWFDVDGDGIRDIGETGIAGVTVQLMTDPDLDGTYTVATSDTTDAAGNYIFDGLAAGAYVVNVDTASLPAGFVTTPTGDPDGDNNSMSDPIFLAPGDVVATIDFGYDYTDAGPTNPNGNVISGVIFIDPDVNGAQGAGESGLREVAISLVDTTGAVVATTWSDENGAFSFPGLVDGTYQFRIDDTWRSLDGLALTTAGAAIAGTGNTIVLSDSSMTGVQLGYAPTGHTAADGLIGNRIWLDQDGDGTQDSGETGMQGVDVVLISTGGARVTTTTNINGEYFFGGLDETVQWYVEVDTNDIPNGMYNVYDPDGSVTNFALVDLPSDADGYMLNQDFGYVGDSDKVGSIGNLVWYDTNGDGVKDSAEVGIDGVTVDLYWDQNGNGTLDVGEPRLSTATTSGGGAYLFDNLSAENVDYLVDVSDRNNMLDGTIHTISASPYDNNDSGPDPYDIRLELIEANNLTADFGYVNPASAIGNYVWSDWNHNGIQDEASETGINGVEVTLVINYGGGAVVTATTVTTNDPGGDPGWYEFTNLVLDEDLLGSLPTYTISVDSSQSALSNYEESPVDSGSTTDMLDSDEHDGVVATIDLGNTDTLDQNPASGEDTIASYDFGYAPLGNIGDFIWGDYDESGTNSAVPANGDVPLQGVTVVATRSDGQTYTTTTNASGMYNFNVPYDTYTVTVVTSSIPMTWTTTPSYDPFGAADSVSVVTISNATPTNTAQDFSYPPAKGELGNFIWGDFDQSGANATDDPGDTPLAGVRVNATDALGNVYTQTTGATGYYTFSVPYGTYTISVDTTTIPVTWTTTPTYDPNGGADSQSVVSIGVGNTTNYLQDFSYPPAMGTIGDFIWGDYDESGGNSAVPANGDVPLEGVIVNAVDSYGNVYTDTTDVNGMYLFNLPYETYTVTVVTSSIPVTWTTTPTYDPFGAADGQSVVTINTSTPNNTAQDFSYPPAKGEIGNYIWGDFDESGSNANDHAGDTPLAGVRVNAVDALGNVYTQTTGATGYYTFSVPYGAYTVTVDTTTIPVTWTTTPTYDPYTTADSVSVVTIDSGTQTNYLQDFSYPPVKGVIGDFIWADVDDNGASSMTGDDEPLAGIRVLITDSHGQVYTVTTNASGFYSVTVPLDTYTVTVDTSTLPVGIATVPTYDPQGGNDGQSVVTLTAATPNNLDQDFSFPLTAAVGDYVWYDADNDGLQDAAEYGIGNVLVGLYASDGTTLLQTEYTNSRGGYLFDQLNPDTYYVRVIDDLNVTNGMSATTGSQVHDGADPIVLDAGDIYVDADFGYYRDPAGDAIIGDTIWYDADGDGEQGPGELGIPNVTITVTNGVSTFVVTTDELGKYYVNVPAGIWTVTVDPTTLPPGLTQTWDYDESLDNTTTVVVNPGDVFLDADFGYSGAGVLGSIGNQIWYDTTADGVFDSGSETGVAGVTVELIHDTNGNGTVDAGELIVASVTTNVDGTYLFDGVPGDDYLVYVSDDNRVLLGYTPTTPGTPATDNNSQAQPYAITLPNGGSNLTADFGYVPLDTFGTPLGSIGNQVWHDLDTDGYYDADSEDGIAGVVVELWQGGSVVMTTTTNSEGRYLFNNLPAATYEVRVLDNYGVLTGYNLSVYGATPGADNNHQEQPYEIVLGAAEVNLTGDFGYILPREATAVTMSGAGASALQVNWLPALATVAMALATAALLPQRRDDSA